MIHAFAMLLWGWFGGPIPAVPTPSAAIQTQWSVAVFLSPECPISKSQTPELRALEKAFPEVAFSYYFPVQNTTEALARSFCERYSLNGAIYVGSTAFQMAQKQGATTLPECFVLDERGRIQYSGRIENSHARPGKRKSTASERDLYNALTALQNGHKPDVAETPAVGCKITFPNIP